MSSWTQTLSELVPSAKAITVIVTVSTGAFMAGVGVILGFGDYADLPERTAVLEAHAETADSLIAEFRSELETAAEERAQILCLIRLQLEENGLTPLQVAEECPG